MALSCPIFDFLSTNQAVAAVNIKNKFRFLDPCEALSNIERTIPIPMNVTRTSEEKRPNSLFYDIRKAKKHNVSDAEGTSISSSTDNPKSNESESESSDSSENDDSHVDALDMNLTRLSLEEEQTAEHIIPISTPPTVQSTSDLPTGFWGRSASNVARYISLRVKTRPEYAIPDPSSTSCIGNT